MDSNDFRNYGYLLRDIDMFPGFCDTRWDPRHMMKKKKEFKRLDYSKYCEDSTLAFIKYLNEHACDFNKPDNFIKSFELIQVCHTKDSSIRPDRPYMIIQADLNQLISHFSANPDIYQDYYMQQYCGMREYMDLMMMYPEINDKMDKYRWDLMFDAFLHTTLDLDDLSEYMLLQTHEIFEHHYEIAMPLKS